MSSTNDALSYLVGLANAKAAAASASSSEKWDSQHHDLHQSGQDSSSANVIYFDERYDDGIPISQDELNRQRQMQRELGKLQFVNPGGLMTQPTNTRRSRRKINARAVAEDKESTQEKRHVFHDKKGKLVVPGEESMTLCDCLIPECHGCHWPCANCGGRLCGPVCQQNRKKFVSCVKVLGITPEVVVTNPYVKLNQ
ncbi:unnamed protein product [Haemonchus placei]|uniref:ARF7EP_C domain-containing protein n=1 Tax=Haemonchus placei TaxID=6290 RepID=A0A0N4X5Y4_HAEPC|nr:Protein B0336.5, isoform a [Haemonchus contortus]VDO79203.1 unnamed protein product [Haemonchus placei]